MRLRNAGFQLDGGSQVADRAVKIAAMKQDFAQSQLHFGVCRAELHGLLEFRLSSREISGADGRKSALVGLGRRGIRGCRLRSKLREVIDPGNVVSAMNRDESDQSGTCWDSNGAR